MGGDLRFPSVDPCDTLALEESSELIPRSDLATLGIAGLISLGVVFADLLSVAIPHDLPVAALVALANGSAVPIRKLGHDLNPLRLYNRHALRDCLGGI